MNHRTFKRLGLCVTLALLTFGFAAADAFYFPLEELIKRSDLILKVKLKEARYHETLMVATAEVQRVFKGEHPVGETTKFIAIPVRELGDLKYIEKDAVLIVMLQTPPIQTGKNAAEINALWKAEKARVLIGPQGVVAERDVNGTRAFILPATPIKEKVRRYKIQKWKNSRSWSTMYFSNYIAEEEFAKFIEDEEKRIVTLRKGDKESTQLKMKESAVESKEADKPEEFGQDEDKKDN